MIGSPCKPLAIVLLQDRNIVILEKTGNHKETVVMRDAKMLTCLSFDTEHVLGRLPLDAVKLMMAT